LLMDDAAAITKVAVKKTVPILGDDLAVGAEKAAGFHASRELPVLWAITKGSFLNKLIILPMVFLLNFMAPWSISYILIIGGLYLAFEGAEKVYEVIEEKVLKKSHHKTKKVLDEKSKIKSAILTDFILSIEIVVIGLSTVLDQLFLTQVIAVTTVAIIATIGVYGIVALLVRMDDVGFYIIKNSEENSTKESFGKLLVSSLPKVIKILAVIGTFAMLAVAGGILVHNIGFFHYIYEDTFHTMPSILFDIILGLAIGFIVFVVEQIVVKIFKK